MMTKTNRVPWYVKLAMRMALGKKHSKNFSTEKMRTLSKCMTEATDWYWNHDDEIIKMVEVAQRKLTKKESKDFQVVMVWLNKCALACNSVINSGYAPKREVKEAHEAENEITPNEDRTKATV